MATRTWRVFDSNNHALRIIENNGNGQAFTETAVTTGQALNVTGIRAARLNSDARPDLALSLFVDTARAWFQNGGTFAAAGLVTLPGPAGATSQSLSVGDYDDNDGAFDIFVRFIAPNLGRLYTNDGSGSFTTSDSTIGADVFSIQNGDFNLDGLVDVGTGGFDAGNNAGDAGILLSQGDSGFAPVVSFPAAVNEIIRGITVGDFNGDGLPDVLMGPQPGRVSC